MKNYEVIEFYWGDLSQAVEKLLEYKEQNKLGMIEFNGVKLYSDTVTMDDAYLAIVGSTKGDHDAYLLEQKRKYDEELRLHEESIPKLTEEWIAKGHTILSKDKWELWDSCVPIRLKDLYRGFELECCLDLTELLNGGCHLNEAKKMIDNQGHSGMSFGLICSMMLAFCDRGEEFVNYIR